MEDLLERLAVLRDDLAPAEKRVAERALDHPESIVRMPLKTFAAAAKVSEPTVLRVVRALGLSGYPEFKLRVAQSLVRGQPYLHREIAPGDGPDVVAAKIFDSTVFAVNSLRATLDAAAVRRAIDLLHKASRIECYGNGPASILAFDAQQKFMRYGIPSVAYLEGHLQTMAAASLSPGAVALCFSHTGAVRDIVRTAEAAAAAGAKVIAITRAGSPLAAKAHVVVHVAALENTELTAPMVSRVAQSVVIDILVTGVGVALGAPVNERLRRIKDSVAETRIPPRQATTRKRRRIRKTT
ncbi:MAG: SIS domain-containing protein [Telmatospirillum sp.]|nr:SIS domain-containing protein [Telmatospirillum sp.]